MNAIEQARMAYSSPKAPVRTAQSIEYDAFARVTRTLSAADPTADFPSLASAVHDNRRLWRHIAVHVADAANKLPADLRARLFYLAEFTETTSRKVLAERRGAEVLVEINTAVMRGLRAQEASK